MNHLSKMISNQLDMDLIPDHLPLNKLLNYQIFLVARHLWATNITEKLDKNILEYVNQNALKKIKSYLVINYIPLNQKFVKLLFTLD